MEIQFPTWSESPYQASIFHDFSRCHFKQASTHYSVFKILLLSNQLQVYCLWESDLITYSINIYWGFLLFRPSTGGFCIYDIKLDKFWFFEKIFVAQLHFLLVYFEHFQYIFPVLLICLTKECLCISFKLVPFLL